MCGIAGALDSDVGRAEERVRQMNDRQRHRGPDDDVVHRVGSFSLGNTRLAIQDPGPDGNQPFFSTTGRLCCVFNGEIYNYQELVKRYCLNVTSDGDGAVIPALWERMGIGALRELRGMYALAVHDRDDDTLVLARDPFGIKPLHLRHLPGGVVAFASELRPLLALDGLRPRLAPEALVHFLQMGSVATDQAPFSEVEVLPPNRWIRLRPLGHGPDDQGQIWDGAVPQLSVPTDQSLGPAFIESVDIHLRADVPVALLLSAGADSTAIASVAHRVGRRLECFTVATGGDIDESDEAKLIAEHYSHAHSSVKAELTATDVDRFFAAMQRPSIDGLNSYLVSKAIAEQGFKVALSGLGGDEALGGYRHMRQLAWLRVLRAADRVPGATEPAVRVAQRRADSTKLTALLRPGGPRSASGLSGLYRELFCPDDVEALSGVRPERVGAGGMGVSRREMIGAELVNYLQPTLLADGDAFSMCASLEMRVPFVDPTFFSVAARLAARGNGKTTLAKALADDFLLSVVRRPKTGFSLPYVQWLTDGALAERVQAMRDPAAPIWDHVDRGVAERLMGQAPARRYATPWAFTVLNGWLKTFDRRVP